MAHPGTEFVHYIILAVGVLATALAAIAWAAHRRTKDVRLLWVGAAFVVFAAKEVVTGYAIVTESIAHESLELVNSLLDLVVLVLLVVPFLWRR